MIEIIDQLPLDADQKKSVRAALLNMEEKERNFLLEKLKEMLDNLRKACNRIP